MYLSGMSRWQCWVINRNLLHCFVSRSFINWSSNMHHNLNMSYFYGCTIIGNKQFKMFLASFTKYAILYWCQNTFLIYACLGCRRFKQIKHVLYLKDFMSTAIPREQSWCQSIILCGTNSNVLAYVFKKGQHSYVTGFLGKWCERSDAAYNCKSAMTHSESRKRKCKARSFLCIMASVKSK